MADQLFRVRILFVEKVSVALLSQLMDDLLQNGVLNQGQVDAIREEHRQRAEQARDLIDTVRRKGDIASNQLIKCLKERDLNVYTELERALSEQ
ncbi:caspase-1-A-like [Megalops cyprinoides]|uniref:caspase-1-A-like n=1 Tax=Megalops cyprinoides TaxID=118141 RepID=UPI00186496E2|nr:caspase-1-A-like [Megalops cyprinoides]